MAPQLCLILLYSEAENALGYWEIFSFWECNVDWHDITHDDDGTNILYSSTQKVNEKNSFFFFKKQLQWIMNEACSFAYSKSRVKIAMYTPCFGFHEEYYLLHIIMLKYSNKVRKVFFLP